MTKRFCGDKVYGGKSGCAKGRMDHQLSNLQLRVLVAIIVSRHCNERVTVRKLTGQLGYLSKNSIVQPLKKLRKLGLIEWGKGKYGTIMPTCQLSLFVNKETP